MRISDGVQTCALPILNTEEFRRNRTQRKTWNRHSELVPRSMPLHWSAEHFDLYQRYQCVRHPGAGQDEDSQAHYTQFLLPRRVNSRLVEFRLPSGPLQMVFMVDILDKDIDRKSGR